MAPHVSEPAAGGQAAVVVVAQQTVQEPMDPMLEPAAHVAERPLYLRPRFASGDAQAVFHASASEIGAPPPWMVGHCIGMPVVKSVSLPFA